MLNEEGIKLYKFQKSENKLNNKKQNDKIFRINNMNLSL